MRTEVALLNALAKVTDSAERDALWVELMMLRRARAQQAQATQDTVLADEVIRDHLTPVLTHVRHTADTDWVGDQAQAVPQEITQQMTAEAALWFNRTSQELRADREEFGEQANGFARHAASRYDDQAPAAARAFLDHVAHLYRKHVKVAAGQPVTCDYCGASVAEGGLRQHYALCPSKPLKESAYNGDTCPNCFGHLAYGQRPCPTCGLAEPWVDLPKQARVCAECGILASERFTFEGGFHRDFCEAHAVAEELRPRHEIVARQVIADDKPGKVDHDQSGNAESQTDYSIENYETEPFDPLAAPPSEDDEVPSTRAPVIRENQQQKVEKKEAIHYCACDD